MHFIRKTLNFNYCFLIFFSIYYFSIVQPFYYGFTGIDASWTQSLVMALDKKLEFGSEFIFNYGPLGFLNTGLLPKGLSPAFLLLFYVFLLLNYLFIINETLTKYPNYKYLLAGFFIMLVFPGGFFADSTFTLFYFLLFWLLNFNSKPSKISIPFIVINAVLIMFIKLNLSFIAIGVLVFSLVYICINQRSKITTSVFILFCVFISTKLIANYLHFNIKKSLIASSEIIDAYQDGMTVIMSKPLEVVVYFGFTLILVLVFLTFVLIKHKYFKNNILLYLLIGIGGFLAYKQGFTALANINMIGYFAFLPALALLLILFFEEEFLSQKHLLFVFLIAFVLKTIITVYIGFTFKNKNIGLYIKSFIPAEVSKNLKNPNAFIDIIKLNNPIHYFQKMASYDYENNFKDTTINNERNLPKSVLNKISNQTIDILPWEISYLFFNKLNYHPRPIIQSYQANSDWLVNQNAKFSFSQNKPKFVFANIHEFREQNAFWTDKGSFQSLFYNYQLVDTVRFKSDILFLFENNIKNIQLKPKNILIGRASIDQKIHIPSSNQPIYLYADLKYNLVGKIRRFLFQPYYLRCEVIFENGTKAQFRIPPPILRGGILVNKKVTNNRDFVNYQIFKGSKNSNIISIRFYTNENKGFEPEFDYTLKQE